MGRRRAIIDEDEFPSAERLGEHTVDRRLEHLCRWVIDRSDDREARPRHRLSRRTTLASVGDLERSFRIGVITCSLNHSWSRRALATSAPSDW